MFRRSTSARPTCPPRPSQRRLRLQQLEDRLAPATFAVTTFLDVVDPNDRVLSLREAIGLANVRPGADTIVLRAGVYNLTRAGAGENANLTGDLDISDSLTIRGAGAGRTFIDGQQIDRVFDIRGAGPTATRVTLNGVAIRNGSATSVTEGGGGISVTNAGLTLVRAAVIGNRTAGPGGGISNALAPDTSHLILTHSLISENVSNSAGGGLFVSGGTSTVTLSNSVVSQNTAIGNGGGIRATTATLTRSTVSGNTSQQNGGGLLADTATLTRSTVSGNIAQGEGGGLSVTTANLTRSTVSGNSAQNVGGGLSAVTANLTDSTVSGNTARLDGGGIWIDTANLTNTTVSGNTAQQDGGGVYALTTVDLSRSTVSGNFALRVGGGLLAPTTNLTHTTVSDNTAQSYGGGIYASLMANLTHTTVSGNSTQESAGGLFAGTANLTNTTVSGNTAQRDGGGLWVIHGSLLSTTIVGNQALNGGGVFRANFGTLVVQNTLIARNVVRFGGTGPDINGTFTSQGNNLIGVGAGGTGFANGVNNDQVGTLVNPIDPKVGPLRRNGGPTQTHALLAGSPAINKGNTAAVSAAGLAFDQRGPGFKRIKGSAVDIGAFER